MNQTQVDDLDTQLALAILEGWTERTLLPDSNNIGTKTKSKTRGVADTSSSPSEPEDQQTPPSPIEPTSTPTAKLNKGDHRTFLTLFHIPDADGVPGELPWIDFLHAMGSAGFSMKKLNGPHGTLSRGRIWGPNVSHSTSHIQRVEFLFRLLDEMDAN